VIALQRAERRNQAGLRFLGGHILTYHADFGQHFAVIELRCRYIAFRIDLPEVIAVFSFLVGESTLLNST
jgi:hypothetical protein